MAERIPVIGLTGGIGAGKSTVTQLLEEYMMGQVSDVTSPQDVVQAARAVAPYVTVDADLTLMDAANIANSMRGIGSGSVTEIEVPVIDDTTSGGAAVLRASEPVDEIVAEFLSTTAADKGTVLGLAG